jgi:hypothetical protein
MQNAWMTIGFAFVVGVVAVATSTGCKGAGGSCVDGAYKDADTGVCLKLGGNLAAEKARKVGQSSSMTVRDSKTLHTFAVWIEPADGLAKRAKAVENMASSDLMLVDKGDNLTNGQFFHFRNAKQGYDFAVALVPGKEHFYRCEIQNAPADEAKTFLDACKTLWGP